MTAEQRYDGLQGSKVAFREAISLRKVDSTPQKVVPISAHPKFKPRQVSRPIGSSSLGSE